MVFRAVVLGCGSSGGVPRVGGRDGEGDWGACDRQEPRNRRTRCSLLIQKAHPDFGWQWDKLTTLLVDTSPDLGQQLVAAKTARLDAVLYTHDHADQSHGIDDLRMVAIHMKQRVRVFIDDLTSGNLKKRFAYCFTQPPHSPYPAILDAVPLPGYDRTFEISGPSGAIKVCAFEVQHGSILALGFKFSCGGAHLIYTPDVSDLSDDSFVRIEGARYWLVDSLRYKPHPSHAHLEKTLEWIARARVGKAILTNMHVDMDYATLKALLPEGVVPAYDQMMCIVE